MGHAQELLQIIGERIGAQGGVERVFGQPITVDGRTLVPVARVRFGFGAGSGGHRRGEDTGAETDGGGGGGGLQATPVGVLEVTATNTRFIRFNRWEPLAMAVAAGVAIGWLVGHRR
jgi:uncharacterized spore protein YtfJ